ncbi:MAG: L-serine ammonia-lyase [Arenicellales bacterium]
MSISVFDLFKVGIGPSSSHTVGPMLSAWMFAARLRDDSLLDQVARLGVELFGSLGATGKGHGSDWAVMLGLEGARPDTIDPASVGPAVSRIRSDRKLTLPGNRAIRFVEAEDLAFHKRRTLPTHPNGMQFTAYDAGGAVLLQKQYYSIGGGFVVDDTVSGSDRIKPDDTELPCAFTTGAQMLTQCHRHDLPISAVMMKNETSWRSEEETRRGLLHIWSVMRECVVNGCRNEGHLPGKLQVRRRAPELLRRLQKGKESDAPFAVFDWTNLYALAVNEENAAGGRVVTAPTNGAAGIVPAVLHYYANFIPDADDDGVVRFLLTAGAIGILYKENASISGAEVGCQGEVGSACSMAAGALAEVLGGTPEQVENAAEIAMEHNLGLTCDPVGGLVQIPCIERNGIAATKAINAARLALHGDGRHYVSLDKVIRTMRQTGADMKTKYKETSRGGLAVNVIEC